MVYRIGTPTPRSASPTPTVSSGVSNGLSETPSILTPRTHDHETAKLNFKAGLIDIIKEEIKKSEVYFISLKIKIITHIHRIFEDKSNQSIAFHTTEKSQSNSCMPVKPSASVEKPDKPEFIYFQPYAPVTYNKSNHKYTKEEEKMFNESTEFLNLLTIDDYPDSFDCSEHIDPERYTKNYNKPDSETTDPKTGVANFIWKFFERASTDSEATDSKTSATHLKSRLKASLDEKIDALVKTAIKELGPDSKENLITITTKTIDEESKTYEKEIEKDKAITNLLIERARIQQEHIKQNTLEKLIESFRNDDSETDKSKDMIFQINGLEIDPKLMHSLIQIHYSDLEKALKHINNSVYFDKKKKEILGAFRTNKFDIEKKLIPELFESKAGKALTNLLQIKSINLIEASDYTLRVPYGYILPDIIERYEEENTNKRPSKNNTLLLEMHEFGWSILKGIPKHIDSLKVQINNGAQAQIKQDMNELSSDENFWIACFDFIIERRKANQQGMPSEKEMELLKNIIKRQADVLFNKEQL